MADETEFLGNRGLSAVALGPDRRTHCRVFRLDRRLRMLLNDRPILLDRPQQDLLGLAISLNRLSLLQISPRRSLDEVLLYARLHQGVSRK